MKAYLRTGHEPNFKKARRINNYMYLKIDTIVN